MELKFEDIRIAKRLLLPSGKVELRPHTITLIRGANGSGKSLLLKNMMENALKEGKKAVLLNQSKEALILNTTVLQNIAMTTDADVCKQYEKKITELGFAGLLSRNINRLSGGEARMVCILRCLLSDGEVVFLDEPTNDLDVDAIRNLQKLLVEMKNQKCIVMVSHDDRMEKIAACVYEINQQSIKFVEEKKITGKASEVGEKTVSGQIPPMEKMNAGKGRGKYLHKMFSINFFSLFCVTLFGIMLFTMLTGYCRISDRIEEEEHNNQIFLFQPYSKWARFENGDAWTRAFPAEFVNVMRTADAGEMLRSFQKMTQYLDDGLYYTIYKSLDLESTELYDVYPLEYYDMSAGDKISVLEKYSEKYYLDENGVRPVSFGDTRGLFYAPDYFSEENGITVDKDCWMEVAEELSKGAMTCSAAYIVAKEGHKVDEFFESESFRNLYGKQVFVSSEGLRKVFSEINGLRYLCNEIGYLACFVFSTIILSVAFILLFLNTQKVRIRVCRDYGIPWQEVFQSAGKKLLSRSVFILPVLAFALINYRVVRKMPALQVNWIFTAMMIIEASLMYYVQKKVIAEYLKYSYRWNVR